MPLTDVIIDQNIRYHKPNDPYYWEVDNLPLVDIMRNMVLIQEAFNTALDNLYDQVYIDAADTALGTRIDNLKTTDLVDFDSTAVPPGDLTQNGKVPAWSGYNNQWEPKHIGTRELWDVTDTTVAPVTGDILLANGPMFDFKPNNFENMIDCGALDTSYPSPAASLHHSANTTKATWRNTTEFPVSRVVYPSSQAAGFTVSYAGGATMYLDTDNFWQAAFGQSTLPYGYNITAVQVTSTCSIDGTDAYWTFHMGNTLTTLMEINTGWCGDGTNKDAGNTNCAWLATNNWSRANNWVSFAYTSQAYNIVSSRWSNVVRLSAIEVTTIASLML
tara:strand:+ start:6353 stop:7345 length:993 start_codon:yes stop_codon:yes gene_type:complete